MHGHTKRTIVLLAALALVALPLVHASHEGEHCYTTSSPEVDTGTATSPRYYVDNDMSPWWPWSTWVYEESNGVDGLQRDDEMRTDFGGCERVDRQWYDYDGSVVRGDTVIF